MAFITKPVLAVDIVDFSLRSGAEQMEIIKDLIEMLHQAIPEDQNSSSARIWSPGGDGGCITFWENIHAPLDTAISLAKLIAQYNSKLLSSKLRLQLRMGIHSGPVTKEKDFDNRENIWGDGINMATRIMSLAKPDQILVSEDYYQQAELFTRTKQEVTSIGRCWTKHNKSSTIYNIYIEKVGIPSSEVEEWVEQFHHPLEVAIKSYEAIAEEHAIMGRAFRAAVIAKRLIDLNPQHKRAHQIIESVAAKRFKKVPGATVLYDAFFSSLSPDALLYFFQNAKFNTYEKKEVLCKEGDKADSMMMIVSGQVIPLIGREEIKVPDPQNPKRQVRIVLGEGDIVGEMGLFNPKEKRTATLVASKKTIALNLEYHFLNEVGGDQNTPESKKKTEIRKHMWRSYCERTSQNLINTHFLFDILSTSDRNYLLDNSIFLPKNSEDSIKLTIDDLWNFWTIVVTGSIIVWTADKNIEYKSKDCIGPIRLAVIESPYTKVEVSHNTHLVRFPWGIIKNLLDTSEVFYNTCMIEAGKSRRILCITY